MKLCTTYYSDDEGDSWAESVDSVFVGEEDRGARAAFVEAPCIAETDDGRLLMFMRTEMQRIAQSYSCDGGVHWQQGKFNDLVSSRSEIWLDRMPASGDLLCVWNQVSAEETRSGFYRSRLSAAVSKDSGSSWTHFRTLVQTEAGMAQLDRIPANGHPALVLSSGVCPERGPYPPGGHRTIRHPRVKFIDDRVYLRYDDRRYTHRDRESATATNCACCRSPGSTTRSDGPQEFVTGSAPSRQDAKAGSSRAPSPLDLMY